MTICSLDFETRSAFPLRSGGVYPYAEHETTDILCFAWAFDDEAPALWQPGDPFPARLTAHIGAGGEMRAWNAQFERVLWRVGVRKYDFPLCPDALWQDTAAEAAAMALPRGLGDCAVVLGVSSQKDRDGHALMMRMCKPRAPRKGEDPEGMYWADSPEFRARLGVYCQTDVVTERTIYHAVRRLDRHEHRVFRLDQVINDRGIRVDRPLIVAAQTIADQGLRLAAKTLYRLTGGRVEGPTKVAAMKEWLARQGLTVESLAKKPLADLLETELSDSVRAVLETRAETAKSSVAKLKSMLACAGADDRMRGLLLYCGAGTGRWSGRLAQPHNYPRPTLDADLFIDDVLRGDYDALDVLHSPLEVISSMLRSCLVASPGHRFIAADYAGVEARITNWLSGQWDIVRKFARNEDVYMYNALRMAEMQGTPLPAGADKKTHNFECQGGKAVELGAGFQMGPPKFQTTADTMFGLKISLEQAKEFIKFYRTSHPAVVQMWRDMNDDAKSAVREPGTTQWVGAGAKIAFTHRGGYLWMILPSKRPLCYTRPRLEMREAPWSTEERPQYVESVVAWGVESTTRRWQEFHLYGGLLLENAVQAVARDLMADGMLRVEAAGYPVVLTVHDEVLADVPEGVGSVADFERLLVELPAWARGEESGVPCPIAAEGWEGLRYRK